MVIRREFSCATANFEIQFTRGDYIPKSFSSACGRDTGNEANETSSAVSVRSWQRPVAAGADFLHILPQIRMPVPRRSPALIQTIREARASRRILLPKPGTNPASREPGIRTLRGPPAKQMGIGAASSKMEVLLAGSTNQLQCYFEVGSPNSIGSHDPNITGSLLPYDSAASALNALGQPCPTRESSVPFTNNVTTGIQNRTTMLLKIPARELASEPPCEGSAGFDRPRPHGHSGGSEPVLVRGLVVATAAGPATVSIVGVQPATWWARCGAGVAELMLSFMPSVPTWRALGQPVRRCSPSTARELCNAYKAVDPHILGTATGRWWTLFDEKAPPIHPTRSQRSARATRNVLACRRERYVGPPPSFETARPSKSPPDRPAGKPRCSPPEFFLCADRPGVFGRSDSLQ